MSPIKTLARESDFFASIFSKILFSLFKTLVLHLRMVFTKLKPLFLVSSKAESLFSKCFRKQFGKIFSILELTKVRFLICKNGAKVLPQGFEKRKQSFREDGGQKIILSIQGFDWRHKMSIYKLKLGFSRLFDGLWMYPRVYGPAHIKA